VEIAGALGQDQSLDARAIGTHREHARPRRRGHGGIGKASHVRCDDGVLARAQRQGRHAAPGDAFSDDAGDLARRPAQGSRRRDHVRPALGATAVAAVTRRTAVGKHLGAARLCRLG
jgi:hypothetical protein